MSEEQNRQIVQGLFEAFGRGDVPSMLGVLTADVDWRIDGPASVPYFGRHSGHEGVTDFLTKLGTNVEMEKFEPREFITKGDKVVVLGGEGWARQIYRTRLRQRGAMSSPSGTKDHELPHYEALARAPTRSYPRAEEAQRWWTICRGEFWNVRRMVEGSLDLHELFEPGERPRGSPRSPSMPSRDSSRRAARRRGNDFYALTEAGRERAAERVESTRAARRRRRFAKVL